MRELTSAFHTIAPVVDAVIVFLLIYRVLLLIKGTRAVPMLIGLLALILLYFVSQDAFLGLATFNWLLEKFIGSLFLIIVVVFQADIRRALVAFGGAQFFTNFRSASEAQLLDELVKCSGLLAGQRIGALIVLERDAKLDQYMDDSVKLDARDGGAVFVVGLGTLDFVEPDGGVATVKQGGRLVVGQGELVFDDTPPVPAAKPSVRLIPRGTVMVKSKSGGNAKVPNDGKDLDELGTVSVDKTGQLKAQRGGAVLQFEGGSQGTLEPSETDPKLRATLVAGAMRIFLQQGESVLLDGKKPLTLRAKLAMTAPSVFKRSAYWSAWGIRTVGKGASKRWPCVLLPAVSPKALTGTTWLPCKAIRLWAGRTK